MNILILSAGTRNKVVQYFVKTLNGKGTVVATDMSNLAPAIYEADKYYIVPRMTDPGYLDVILDICKKEKITGVLSLIDPELSLLAENREKFEAVGTTVIGSSYDLCEMSLDKFEMYNWLAKNGYKCAKSYMDKDAFFADVEVGLISYPVFVKPARGSASISISKAYDKETVELLFAHEDGLMIQEFLNGQEIGADPVLKAHSDRILSSLGPRTVGKTNIGCIFTGVKDGKEKSIYIYNVCDHQECYKEVESQAISYTTGVPAMIGSMMVVTGQWKKPGVFNVEEFDPDHIWKH